MSPSSASVGPVISIVVPAYNCERFIAETIASIQAQTLADWECIIVDDGSRDRTLALIREHTAADPRFRAATQPNSGPAVARNHGLGLIDPHSEYVVFMDSDDLWLPEALEVLKSEIDKHPGALGAHALGRCINQDAVVYIDPVYARNGNGRFICDKLGRIVLLDPSVPTSFQSLWFSNPYPPGLILARRSAYDKAGVFDNTIFPMEDWDMLIRLSRHGDFRFVDKVVLSYRRHDTNLSVQTASAASQQIRSVLHKTFFSAENSPAQRKTVRRNWRSAELLHLRQKARAAKGHLANADFRGVLSAFVGGLFHLCRFARGYPSVRRLPAATSSRWAELKLA